MSGVGDPEVFEARNSGWKKWTPNRPPSAHWYSDEQFIKLIAAHLSDDRTSGRITTIREFLNSFAGLRATQIQKEIAQEAGLSLARLDSLLAGDEIDADRARALLALMRQHSKSIAPSHLGLMGRNLTQSALEPWNVPPDAVSYKSFQGFFDDGLPIVIEMGFAHATEDSDDASGNDRLLFGLNFTPALNNPARDFAYALEDNYIGYNDPVRILVSVTYPCIQFTDTGKTSAEFPPGVQKALAEMLEQLAKPWKKAKLKWLSRPAG